MRISHHMQKGVPVTAHFMQFVRVEQTQNGLFLDSHSTKHSQKDAQVRLVALILILLQSEALSITNIKTNSQQDKRMGL